ncbi:MULTISPECIES: hypothetical protein [unclassified Sphingomonas]|uniref:hypothetical protein n=1 Tax=unclassified Sphingomonas TaxID=196159 RepID=UPI0022699210|nr:MULTISPECIES: hypothetical protein [unclassified Sphingomonas]
MYARSGSRRQFLLILLVALAARAITFGNPVLHVDEEFYYFVGNAMWHGALPFVDVWDRKPVGLFLLYAVPAALGYPAGIWTYQALALASVVFTALMIARLATRAGFARGATLAAIAYILWLDLLGGQGGQAPVFYNSLMILAAALILRGGRWRGAAAMALVGVALQIKYSVVFEGIFFGLWLLAADYRRAGSVVRTAAYGLGLIALALLPTLAAAAYYAFHGEWQAFLYANFLSIFARKTSDHRESLVNAAQLILIVSPLVAMAWASFRGGRGEHQPARRFVGFWLVAAIIGVALFPPWFDHYALPLLVPACIAAAGFLGAGHGRGKASLAILLVVALGGQILLTALRAGRGTPAQFAALAASVGRGPGCLYVYSGNTMLYVVTGRCTLSRYIVPAHLGRTREVGAIGVDQETEIRRILARHPAVVVMRPPYTGERPQSHAIVEQAMKADYVVADRRPMGSEMISVYRLNR